MNDKERKELAVSKVVVLVLAVIAVGCVVWLAWLHPGHTRSIQSFEDCRKAGFPIQLSYPEVCVTKDGQHFTNPEQVNTELRIKEWGVGLSISNVQKPFYTYDKTDDTAYVSTPLLEGEVKKVTGCKSGMHGITFERIPASQLSGQETQGIRVGDYVYRQKSLIETACIAEGNTKAIQNVSYQKAQILGALPTLRAE